MNNKEFEEYLKAFNKSTGQYTEQEIDEIGRTFRQIEGKRYITWQDLADEVGYVSTSVNGICTYSGEAYRKHISRMLIDERRPVVDGISLYNLEAQDKQLSKEEMQVSTKFPYADLYIQQTKTRDILNEYRKTLRDEARIDSMKNSIIEAISKIPELPKVTYVKTKSEVTNEAVLLFSDLHIGAKVDSFYNSYSVEIARKRVNKLVDDTIRYCKRNNVEKLNILNLGDMIQGLIHVGARITQEIDVVQQIITAAEIVADAVNRLQKAAPIVTYRSVLDNHSRAVANKEDHIEKENFCRIIDWYIEERLKSTNVEFVKDNLDATLGKLVLMNGKTMLFTHGNLDSIDSSFQHFTGATKDFVDYACIAHYHSEKMKTYQGFKVFVNGSVMGTDDYALSKRLFSKPNQTLLIFEDDIILNISIELDVK